MYDIIYIYTFTIYIEYKYTFIIYIVHRYRYIIYIHMVHDWGHDIEVKLG